MKNMFKNIKEHQKKVEQAREEKESTTLQGHSEIVSTIHQDETKPVIAEIPSTNAILEALVEKSDAPQDTESALEKPLDLPATLNDSSADELLESFEDLTIINQASTNSAMKIPSEKECKDFFEEHGLKIMEIPVKVPDGEVYDLDLLLKWYNKGYHCCPRDTTIALPDPKTLPIDEEIRDSIQTALLEAAKIENRPTFTH